MRKYARTSIQSQLLCTCSVNSFSKGSSLVRSVSTSNTREKIAIPPNSMPIMHSGPNGPSNHDASFQNRLEGAEVLATQCNDKVRGDGVAPTMRVALCQLREVNSSAASHQHRVRLARLRACSVRPQASPGAALEVGVHCPQARALPPLCSVPAVVDGVEAAVLPAEALLHDWVGPQEAPTWVLHHPNDPEALADGEH